MPLWLEIGLAALGALIAFYVIVIFVWAIVVSKLVNKFQ